MSSSWYLNLCVPPGADVYPAIPPALPTDAVIIGNAEQNDNEQPPNLNISDVYEAVSLATFSARVAAVEDVMAQTQAPYVRIVQQPSSKALRFRYKCEKSVGSIPGASSMPGNRTYPTIKIYGYTGLVTIVVSCVTKDEPFRPHPHNLVGRDRCERGVCTIRWEITEENNEYQFRNLGIQCVKRRDIAEALRIREELRVDPFSTGFGHRNHPHSIDLNAVRLGFQVFLPDATGKMRRSLAPVASEVIYDKKAINDLFIKTASHCSGRASGGTQVILLCEKVTREDIAVVFYQKENNQVVWEETAIIQFVHRQYAIVFKTPAYKNPHITKQVKVRFRLNRLSDNARSNSQPFEYYPEFQDSDYIESKRRKTLIPSLLQSSDEPENKTPPHPAMSMSPPTLNVYTQYAQQDSEMNMGMQAILAEPGPSHVQYQEIPWTTGAHEQRLAPNIQQRNMLALSPNMQQVHPPNMQQGHLQNMQQVHSLNMQQVHSLNMQQVHSPNMQQVHSPNIQEVHSLHQIMSPNMGQSPLHQSGMSPMCMFSMQAGDISPNIVQQVDYTQMVQHNTMESNQRSIHSMSAVSLERDGPLLLASGDISSLSSLRNADYNTDQLSSDLNKLSTSDLLL